ncbi:MAG: [FeFe] hydrogenase H-cluster maturation GTPase HydF [Treponema sp.]|nr:[FeFe] hydrogenase H-cluster maturation GTPase HydF [Candidatus Treponema merdequi]
MEVSRGQRYHIGIFGNANSGKSSLLNMITGQNFSIVSEVSGTTTDAVSKPMEFPGVGPVVFIDTAGFDDRTKLSEKRTEKTFDALSKSDLILAVIAKDELCGTDSAGNSSDEVFSSEKLSALLKSAGFCKLIESKKPIVWVITKVENENEEKQLSEFFNRIQTNNTDNSNSNFDFQNVVFVNSTTARNKEALFQKIRDTVPQNFFEKSLTEDFCIPFENVLLVMPQDTQAPKGRLILPQVETIRDLLDRKVLIHACTNETFKQVLESLKNPPDLIITDSQLFKYVNENKPASSRLTSFSIMQAAYKGDLKLFIEGAKAIHHLTSDSKVLIAEACTHSPGTEDIGREKIPALLRKIAPDIKIDFTRGNDFSLSPKVPDTKSTTASNSEKADLKNYDLIIHCGACMFNRAYMLARQAAADDAGIPMTNYGLALAELTGTKIDL